MSLPPSPPVHPLEASRVLHSVRVPYSSPYPTERSGWKLSFEKPTEITIIGSWQNNLSVKGNDGVNWTVDLALEMPDVSNKCVDHS